VDALICGEVDGVVVVVSSFVVLFGDGGGLNSIFGRLEVVS
jgi:hypothetical protein